VDPDRQAALPSRARIAPRSEIALLALAIGAALLLAVGLSGGLGRLGTAPPKPTGIAPARPSSYRVPADAFRVSSAAGLRTALAAPARQAIVLAPGTYGGRRPFANPFGHQLYSAEAGKAVLTARLSLGGRHGRGGGLVRGLTIDVRDRRRTVNGAAIAVWGRGRDSRILDTTLVGHGMLDAGVDARRPDGLVIERMVVRRFRDYGVLVDANDRGRHAPRTPFAVSDLDVADVGRPQRGSSKGRAEACVWIGDTGALRRVRARSCAGAGLWTGSATRRATFEAIDIDRAGTGVYIEHFTRDSTFRGLRIGREVRVGLNAEWADPAWGRRPASVRNVIERSRFESSLVGVYLDAGTTSTTVRGSSFANQTWAAIGDYRGDGNAAYGNDYGDIRSTATPVRREHLGSALTPPAGG
jgi:hypothetical protein